MNNVDQAYYFLNLLKMRWVTAFSTMVFNDQFSTWKLQHLQTGHLYYSMSMNKIWKPLKLVTIILIINKSIKCTVCQLWKLLKVWRLKSYIVVYFSISHTVSRPGLPEDHATLSPCHPRWPGLRWQLKGEKCVINDRGLVISAGWLTEPTAGLNRSQSTPSLISAHYYWAHRKPQLLLLKKYRHQGICTFEGATFIFDKEFDEMTEMLFYRPSQIYTVNIVNIHRYTILLIL